MTKNLNDMIAGYVFSMLAASEGEEKAKEMFSDRTNPTVPALFWNRFVELMKSGEIDVRFNAGSVFGFRGSATAEAA